jgi:hypothetical protein
LHWGKRLPDNPEALWDFRAPLVGRGKHEPIGATGRAPSLNCSSFLERLDHQGVTGK